MTYRIDPNLPLPDEIRRIGNGEIDRAIEQLSQSADGRHAAMHEARKRFKRLRGLLRLVQGCDSGTCKAEIVRYRDLARTLAGPREAMALVETVDRFIRDFPRKAAGGELAAIRERLVRRRDRMTHDETGLEATLASAASGCRAGRAVFAELPLPGEPGPARELLASGVEHNVRRARKTLKHAARRGAEDDFHELRKYVKTHWMHLLLLQDAWPKATAKRRKLADDLGERLGELNDISVMRSVLNAEDGELGSPRQLGTLRKLMKRKEKALRRSCLKRARVLFAHRPRSVRKQIVGAGPRGTATSIEARAEPFAAAAE